jgi:sterol desaturase/sphingolipid hydroxylase (fatty acid hydroxylase superfamily)
LLAAAASFALVRGAGAVWAHLNVRWRLRPIQKVFITPAVHGWHHATDPDAINTNYAAALPVWDVLFGTFFSPRDRVPSGYGCTEPVPDGFAAQLAYPLRRMRTSRDITDSSLHTS